MDAIGNRGGWQRKVVYTKRWGRDGMPLLYRICKSPLALAAVFSAVFPDVVVRHRFSMQPFDESFSTRWLLFLCCCWLLLDGQVTGQYLHLANIIPHCQVTDKCVHMYTYVYVYIVHGTIEKADHMVQVIAGN